MRRGDAGETARRFPAVALPYRPHQAARPHRRTTADVAIGLAAQAPRLRDYPPLNLSLASHLFDNPQKLPRVHRPPFAAVLLDHLHAINELGARVGMEEVEGVAEGGRGCGNQGAKGIGAYSRAQALLAFADSRFRKFAAAIQQRTLSYLGAADKNP